MEIEQIGGSNAAILNYRAIQTPKQRAISYRVSQISSFEPRFRENSQKVKIYN